MLHDICSNHTQIDANVQNKLFCFGHKSWLLIDNFNLEYWPKSSYRLVLLHALQHYLLQGGHKSFESMLKELRQCDKSESCDFYEPKFIELYPFLKEGERGFVLIDRSKGCYPLVLYPKDKDPDSEHGNRIYSFMGALGDLLDDPVFFEKYLKMYPNWSEEVVKGLMEKFSYPERR